MENVARAIAYLAFAVASADQNVNDTERKAIHAFIDEHWQLLADEDDPFGARTLDFVDKMIPALEANRMSSEEAFIHFKEMFEEKKDLFSSELKTFIIQLCIRTGAAFNQMNKSELVLISRVELLLHS
jgi:uncharacterized tellurite resistance protein B-like protein